MWFKEWRSEASHVVPFKSLNKGKETNILGTFFKQKNWMFFHCDIFKNFSIIISIDLYTKFNPDQDPYKDSH